MARSEQSVLDPDLGDRLSSNNPYKLQPMSGSTTGQERIGKEHLRTLDSEKQVVTGEELSGAGNAPLRSLDSEKQVVSSGVLSGPENAPLVVNEEDTSPQHNREPVREAGKEVVSSWQTKSQAESAPIPMEYHESQSPRGELLNDYKGPPPTYESLGQQSRSDGDDLVTAPTSIEPDSSSSILPAKPEDRTTVGQLLTWIPAAPRIPTTQMPPLFQPVIVPQLDVPPLGESVPFSRCYSDALALHDVSMREFASFLDGLAVAQAPNSALQGLKMFGVGVRSLPLPIIGLAGKGISALATSGSGHSSSRARLYLERAKNEYFAPRGLRLSIVKDNDLNSRLQVPVHVPRLAPLTNNTLTENLCDRRLEGLAPYVAPLRSDVPEQDKEIQGVHKLARKHLEHKFKDQHRKLTRLREEQWRGVSHASLQTKDWDQQYASKMAEMRRLQINCIREQQQKGLEERMSGVMRETMEELQQRQKDLQILITERQMAMRNAVGGSRSVQAEMDEENWSRKLKWIVIETLQ